MGGNAVGPVTLIALGIFLGYLVLTNRTKNLIATLLGTAVRRNRNGRQLLAGSESNRQRGRDAQSHAILRRKWRGRCDRLVCARLIRIGMTTALNPQDHPDVYVAGLCLTLVVASAVPALAGGSLWLSLLLLAVVWARVLQEKTNGTSSVSSDGSAYVSANGYGY